jgi:PAS domain S-box-containing protein
MASMLHFIYTSLIIIQLNIFIVLALLVVTALILASYYTRLLKQRDAQRSRLKQQLTERESQVQTMFRSAPDAVIIIDEKGRILNWNGKAEKMFGWKQEEAIGQLLSDTIIPDRYKQAHDDGMVNYLKTGETKVIDRTIEMQAVNKEKKEFHISLSIAVSKFGNNKVFIGFIRDITEEKKAEDHLQYNALLLQNVTDAIISTDENLVIKSWNTAAEKMYGYKAEEVIGKPINFLGLNLSPETLRDHDQSLKQQGFYRDEYKVQDKSGKELTILASFNSIESADKTKGYVAVHRDISIRKILEAQLRTFNKNLSKMVEEKTAEMKGVLERVKHSEEKYRSLIEQAGDAIAVFNSKMQILDVNLSATKLLGYSTEQLKSMSLKDVLSSTEMRTDPIDFELLESGESTLKPRMMITSRGTVVETEVHAKKLPDGSFLAVIRDLTERKKAEQELKHSYEAIRELVTHLQDIREEERLKMAQEVHDELGQQLTIMKMDVSWLDQKLTGENPALKEKTTALKQTIDATVKTVRRIASELRPSVLDDMGLAVAIEWQTREIEKRSGIKINIDEVNDVPALGDHNKINLFRVVQESLTNVVRYAQATEVKITLKQTDEDIRLTVKDNGIGFDPQTIAVKKTLGILGMRERISALGGSFKLESKPGHGTTVSVCVPLHT